MQSQQLRYKKLIRKVRVVIIDDESFILLSDVQNTFQRPLIRFTLNGEPLGFALDDKYRPLEPLRIAAAVNNNDIIDCDKDESSKYNKNQKEGEKDEILAEMQRVQGKLADLDLATQKILENTDVLIKKADAILRQTYELAEYTVPRLFIILPEMKMPFNPATWFANFYRLFFICEYEPQRHFAFHEGYEIKQPHEFFRKYGPYLRNMITIVRVAIAVSSFVLPEIKPLAGVVEQIPAFLFDKTFQQLLNKNLKKVELAVEQALTESLQPGTTIAVPAGDVVEGVELREIESFLKRTDNYGSFGNLYRSTNENGQVRWLCLYHYRQFSGEKRVEDLRQEFRQLGGEVRLDTAIIEESCARRLEEMLDVICRGLPFFKIILKNCKIRMTAFDKLLLVASQRSLIQQVEFQDVVVSPSVGFIKTHSEVISKLKEALNSNKHLTIQYSVSLDGNALEKDTSLLPYFAMHSTQRLSLRLYANDLIEHFSCSGLSNADLETVLDWICKSKSSWNVRAGDRDRLVFVHSLQGMKQSLLALTHLLLRFQNLRELIYHQTAVGDDVLQALCEALGSNTTSLQRLIFKEKTKTQHRSSVTHLTSMLKNNNTSPTELKSSCVPHLVCMLKSNTSLTEFSLPSICCLHADDVMLITEALRVHPRLCAVKIGCVPPYPIERSYNVFDRLLNGTLIEDFTCTAGGSEQFYDLRNALVKNATLKRLFISVFNLNRTEINDGFCQYVARLPALETFSLSFDLIIDCSRLLRCLALSSSLQSLSLTRVSNWQQLTGLIENGWKLNSLSLCQCDIRFSDIEMLVRSMKSNPQSITELRLSNNNLSDDSAIKLGGALISEFFPLNILDLSNNTLSLTCILCLVKMLHFNTVLKVLDIRSCLKRDDQEKYNPAEVQECKRAIADLIMLNEFVEVRWDD